MKQVNNMSRLVNQLQHTFNLLNADLFDNTLPVPVITVTPSPRSYAHYTPYDAWETASGGKREINIASGTLNRPIEAVVASLLHEMCHMYNDIVLGKQDVSRRGLYHNARFYDTCIKHGLNCYKTEKNGWALTEPNDELLQWILDHNEIREIELCRVDPFAPRSVIGTHASESGNRIPGANPNSHSRRYSCPACGMIVRATRTVNVICGDCMTAMIEG